MAAEPESADDGLRSGTLKAEDQLLRYATELRRLHEVERADRQQMAALQQALTQAQGQQLAILVDLKRAYEAERQRRQELQEAYVATIKALAIAVEARDDYTGGHIERVRTYSHILGQRLGLDQPSLRRLDVSAILHDLGKIGVPDSVLTKAEPLNDEEWRLMKRHPEIGAGIANTIPFLSPNAEALASHHERWDGTGYPRGLKGEAIPLEARIIAVADAFDAMTTDRVYRRARGIGAAVEEVTDCSGSQFEPGVVDAFFRAFKAAEIP